MLQSSLTHLNPPRTVDMQGTKKAKARGGTSLTAMAVLITMLGGSFGVAANWNWFCTRYHVMLLRDAEQPIPPLNTKKFKYSMHWARWKLEGKPDRVQQEAEEGKHEQALMALGYCERRVYELTNSAVRGFCKAIEGHPFKDGILSITMAGRPDRMAVFAVKEDFPFVEEKLADAARRSSGSVRQLDRQKLLATSSSTP